MKPLVSPVAAASCSIVNPRSRRSERTRAPTFGVSLRVAVGDLIGPSGGPDGIHDLIVTPGPGSLVGATIEIYDGTKVLAAIANHTLSSLQPTAFLWPYLNGQPVANAGMFVATGNLSGSASLVIGIDGLGFLPQVLVYSNAGLQQALLSPAAQTG